jgi:sialate O-acetylesterase
VPLDRGWRWRIAPGEWPPRAPWHTAAGLSTLYNGMIAPIGRYGFRGVAWYQGESNTGEASRYASLLASLIGDWRARFDDAALPWLNVQLAGYGAAPTQPGESAWAELREVQRRFGERDPRYGFATAVDLGDRYDIHPPNKQEVGRRLARLARHLVYGETTLAPSGPVPVSVRRDGDEIVVRFDRVEQALVAYGADAPIGFELCRAAGTPAARATASGDGARAASETPLVCRYAQARIDGDHVRLHDDPARPATRVRHAWADCPVITLFDRSGLPAQPFDLPVESGTPTN